jgi:hypothetical protein
MKSSTKRLDLPTANEERAPKEEASANDLQPRDEAFRGARNTAEDKANGIADGAGDENQQKRFDEGSAYDECASLLL